MRPTLLRVLTDLYLQKRTHPPGRRALLHRARLAADRCHRSPRAQAALAARLAPYPAAPRAVIARLARDVIEVAEPILTQSPCLTPADLEAIAEERGPAYAAIIATRGQPGRCRSSARATVPMQANASPESEAVELCELFYRGGRAGAPPDPDESRLLLDRSLAAALPDAAHRRLAPGIGGPATQFGSGRARARARARRIAQRKRAGSCRTSWASRSWSPPRP